MTGIGETSTSRVQWPSLISFCIESLLPFLCIVLANAYFAVAAFSCASFSAVSVTIDHDDFLFGFWGTKPSGKNSDDPTHCSMFQLMDGYLTLGKWMSVVGSTLGLLLLAFSLSALFYQYTQKIISLVRIIMLCMIFVNGFLLVGLRTKFCTTTSGDFVCSFTKLGYISFAASVGLWVLTAATFFPSHTVCQKATRAVTCELSQQQRQQLSDLSVRVEDGEGLIDGPMEQNILMNAARSNAVHQNTINHAHVSEISGLTEAQQDQLYQLQIREAIVKSSFPDECKCEIGDAD